MTSWERVKNIGGLFDEALLQSETPFDEYRHKISVMYDSFSSEEKLLFGEYVKSKMKLSLSELSAKYESYSTERLIRELKIHLLFVLECQRLYSHTQELSADHELSDWITGLAGRLSLCFPDRTIWKRFLHDNIVRIYGSCFGKTLYNVYLNLGLVPPDCLPKDESEVSGTQSSSSDSGEKVDRYASQSASSLGVSKSFATRAVLRQSLPRALFTDPAIVAATADVMSRSSPASADTARTPLTASTPAPQSVHKSTRDSSSLESRTSTSAPQLVLINSQRPRRKCRTPTKRISVGRSSRRCKIGQTPPTDKSTSGSNSNRRTPSRGRQNHSNAVVQQRRRTEPVRQCKSAHASRNPITPHSGALALTADAEPKTPKHQSRRSVHETPNPERSYPRWERARLAAAEKTKDKAIIVEESPIKPAISIGSPLRRLRRANSMLASLLYVEAKESATTLSQSSSLSRDTEDVLVAPSDQLGSDGSGCLSITMSRAERWRRRRLEEECSLSQFTVPSDDPIEHKPSDTVELSRLTPNCGLLCIPTDLRRENSNLFANMMSPESQGSGFFERSPEGSPLKTPRKNIFRSILSPPTGSPLSPRRTTVTSAISTPPFCTITNACILQSSPRKMNRLTNRVPRTPRTTPRRRSTMASRCRTRHSSGGGLTRAVLSPQIFDEDAMFLGRDEFLNETNNTSSHCIESPLRTLSNTSDNDIAADVPTVSSQKRQCLSPPASLIEAPIARLLNIIPDNEPSLDSLHSPCKRSIPCRSRLTANVASVTSTDEVPEFLPRKPRRSPFAPLHVFNRLSTTVNSTESDNKSFPPSELSDCATTTNTSSQSASAIVALRTRLFGNSDSDGALSTECDNRSLLENSRSTRKIDASGTSDDSKENSFVTPHGGPLPDTPPDQMALSSGLKQLHRSARDKVDFQKPLSMKEPRFRISNFCPESRTANSRPRRSLFQ